MGVVRSLRGLLFAAGAASLALVGGPFLAGASAASGAPRAHLARGLPEGLQPTQVNVTGDSTHRYGEPEVAVNPRNPGNLVYIVMSEHWNYACQAAGDPVCQLLGPPPSVPLGVFTEPGFFDAKVFVSFDRGKAWTNVSFPGFPRGHPDLLSKEDPMVTATADGTFYIAWDDSDITLTPTPGLRDGGIAVSKSTDGGRTWSEPVLTGTPVDRPWLTADLSDGTIYEGSSGTLGPGSTGDPNAPSGNISDRWLAASRDGVHWTTPQRLGGGGVPGFSGAAADTISAARGVLAATFRSTSPLACGGPVPVTCTVFQTTRDAGVTWARHLVPVPSDSAGSVMVAADPARAGHYTAAVLNAAQTQFLVYQTCDSGRTWRGPAAVAEDATKTHFKPWIAYSPEGVLGLMWRTNQPGQGPTFPYNVWAATSDDGGATFSRPLEVSTGNSPAPDPRQLVTDDVSFISLGRHHAFIAWGDWRPGEMSGYFSAIKLHAFRPGGS